MHLDAPEGSVPFCEDATGLRECVRQRVHGGFPLLFLPAFLPHSVFLTHMGDKTEDLVGVVKVVLTERSQGPRSQTVQNEQKKPEWLSSHLPTGSYVHILPQRTHSNQERRIFSEKGLYQTLMRGQVIAQSLPLVSADGDFGELAERRFLGWWKQETDWGPLKIDWGVTFSGTCAKSGLFLSQRPWQKSTYGLHVFHIHVNQ